MTTRRRASTTSRVVRCFTWCSRCAAAFRSHDGGSASTSEDGTCTKQCGARVSGPGTASNAGSQTARLAAPSSNQAPAGSLWAPAHRRCSLEVTPPQWSLLCASSLREHQNSACSVHVRVFLKLRCNAMCGAPCEEPGVLTGARARPAERYIIPSRVQTIALLSSMCK